MDVRAVESAMLGYGDVSHSNLFWLRHVTQVRQMPSITRFPLSQRWIAGKLEDIDVTKKHLEAGRGARAMPFLAGSARRRTWTQCAWQAREAPGAWSSDRPE